MRVGNVLQCPFPINEIYPLWINNSMRSPMIQILLRGDAAWWQSRRMLLHVLAVVLSLLAFALPEPETAPLARLERAAFDLQMQWLREFYPRPVAVDPVLIGIDENTVALFPEPLALWHGHLAKTLEALTHAKPVAVGVDLVLPERSFENILPGVQLALIRSLLAIKQHTNAIFVSTVDSEGKEIPIHPSYLRFLGKDNFGTDQARAEPDAVSRRFSERIHVGGAAVPTFAGQIARGLGKPVGEGYIDYSRGGRLDHIPMQQVIGWLQDEDEAELKRAFDGKVVLIGSLLKDRDQWKLPVLLSNWEGVGGKHKLEQSGVVIHVQTLRSLLGAGLIMPLPAWATWLAILLLASVVWAGSSLRVFLIGGLLGSLGLMALSLLLLLANLALPVAACIAALVIALVVRATADGLEAAAEKKRLKVLFAGSVSPAVMQEILAGHLAAGASARTMDVCVLFSDIRGFTTLSELLPPKTVTDILTRYFDRMVAVVRRYDGTIDKFMGDGMMVLFGAPLPGANACGNAVQCACDMVLALQELNQEFEREGLPAFQFGIGINYGKAVVGWIGSSERNNYSAIGDVVNVASRLEGLTNRLGCQIAMTESVKLKLGDCAQNFELIDGGEQPIRGHSPLRVWSVKVADNKI